MYHRSVTCYSYQRQENTVSHRTCFSYIAQNKTVSIGSVGKYTEGRREHEVQHCFPSHKTGKSIKQKNPRYLTHYNIRPSEGTKSSNVKLLCRSTTFQWFIFLHHLSTPNFKKADLLNNREEKKPHKQNPLVP